MAETKELKWYQWAYVAPILFALLAPLGLLFAGLGTLLKQVRNWLKTGIWEPKDFWSGISPYMPFDRPHTGWVIPDKMLDYMLDGPRWFWMLAWCAITYGIIIWAIIWLGWQAEKAKARWDVRKERPFLTYQGKVTVAVLTVWFIVIPTVVSLFWQRAEAWWITFMFCFLIGMYGNLAYTGWKKWKSRGAQ